MDKRRISPEKKREIVLEALRKEQEIPQLLTKYHIRLDQLQSWRERFIESGLQGLKYGRSSKEKILEKTIDKQKRIIADQAMTIAILEEAKAYIKKKGLLNLQERLSTERDSL